tara:strand:+ start:2515 stop:3012 length:498 start_codon:yes stop_codon:yes gene_type:complete
MLDVLVILLVFLLKSQSASTNNFTTVPGIEIPYSKSQDSPPDSLHLIITPEGMTFENEKIVEFTQTLDSIGSEPTYQFAKGDIDIGGRRIIPLFDALVQAKEKSELLRAKSEARTDETGEPLKFEGILAIQADKRMSYSILKKVMFTAGDAGFTLFRFLAMRQEQ